MNNDYDIIIVGGGMVGGSMASALAKADFKIAVIEAFRSDSENQPSFDERTVALTYSSKLIFNALGIWPQLEANACPILKIEVTNQNSFGFTTLGIDDIKTEALGYVVPTREIGAALHLTMASQSNLDFLCPATVESIQSNDTDANVVVNIDQQTKNLRAKLVILADGGRSGLMQTLGFKSKAKQYTQCALIGIIGSDRPHHNKAYEHFTENGPLALLPLRINDYALAWTLKHEEAHYLSQCTEIDFVEKLQQNFGKRAGVFKAVGQRHVYPLSMSMLEKPYKQRVVIIGNAAHTVHPVAGQGFNLGLRDVGFLHQLLTSEIMDDPGHSNLLDSYHQLRKHETNLVSQFTDGLIQTFTAEFSPIRTARNIGLSAINLLPGVKKGLLKRTMGIQGRQSKLAILGKQSNS